MGFEIPVDVDYFQHPKTKHLIGLLGARADVFPPRLWAWCCKYARDGIIKGGAVQIEAVLDWDGEPGKLHEALVTTGFLEKSGKKVHDFMEHTGHAILIYEKKKERQRQEYAKGISSGRKLEEKQKSAEEFFEHAGRKKKNSEDSGNSGNSVSPLPPKGEKRVARKREYETPEELKARFTEQPKEPGQ